MEKLSLPTGHRGESGRYNSEPVGASSTEAGTAAARARRQADSLFEFDKRLGPALVAGADEAGRGSLAGPLVAAAVLFDYRLMGDDERCSLAFLNDSKTRSMREREALYPAIFAVARRVAVSIRGARGIDKRGLHSTNLAALRECLAAVAEPECLCLVDGFAVSDFGYEHRALIGGDGVSAAVAAASVVAKVTRDRYMQRADRQYPGWGFGSNVGYSTTTHRAAIANQGITPLHRLSFHSVAYEQLALDLVGDNGK